LSDVCAGEHSGVVTTLYNVAEPIAVGKHLSFSLRLINVTQYSQPFGTDSETPGNSICCIVFVMRAYCNSLQQRHAVTHLLQLLKQKKGSRWPWQGQPTQVEATPAAWTHHHHHHHHHVTNQAIASMPSTPRPTGAEGRGSSLDSNNHNGLHNEGCKKGKPNFL
jgi:hypothetical protein